MKQGLSSIHLTLLALSTITVATGCYTSGGGYRTTQLAPMRSDDAGYRASAGRSGSAFESRSATVASAQGGTTIEVPLYEETLRVGTREVEAGGVRLRKEVQTETVNQPVQLRRETLVIDRVPASEGRAPSSPAQFSGAAGDLSTPFQQKEMEIRLKREEPVVETQVVQKGRIVAQKRTETQQQNVQRQVRREDIDVTPFGNAENVIISENLRRTESTGATGAAAGQTTAVGGSAGVITDISALNASKADALAGKQVRLTATVRQIQGERALIVSGNGGSQVMVRTSQPIHALKEGDQVQITGTLDKMPDDPAALGVSQEQQQQLQNQSVYIEASSVTPMQQ